jgi:hypothetical protein
MATTAASPARSAPGRARSNRALIESILYWVATLGEGFGLWLWLYYLDAGRPWVALGFLIGGFAVERAAVMTWIKKFLLVGLNIEQPPLYKTILGVVAATVIEIGIWHAARESMRMWNVEIAAMLLFLMIHPLHAFEMAGVRHEPVIKFFVRGRTALFSLIEAAGGAVWLGLSRANLGTTGSVLAFVALFGALFAEHHKQAQELQDSGFQV